MTWTRMLLIAALACAAGCADDGSSQDADSGTDAGADTDAAQSLPQGWEDALEVDAYWSPFKDCIETVAATVSAGARDGHVQLLVADLGGPWWPYDVYVRSRGNGYDVLFETTNPGDMWGCDLVNDVRIDVGPGDATTPVAVYRRDYEAQQAQAAPTLVAKVTPDGACGDGANLPACDAGTACEGDDPDELQTMGCHEIEACGGPRCSWDLEACWLECRSDSCAFGSVLPFTVTCE
jgi:hypothetical protein